MMRDAAFLIRNADHGRSLVMPGLHSFLSLIQTSAISPSHARELVGALWVPVDRFAEVKVAFVTVLICVAIYLLCWAICWTITREFELLAWRTSRASGHVVAFQGGGGESKK